MQGKRVKESSILLAQVMNPQDADPVTGMQVRCFQADEVPFAWHDSLDGVYNERLGFGLPVHDATPISIDVSFPKSGWIVVGADTITANNAVAPDGTYTADRLDVTNRAGPGGVALDALVACTGAQPVAFSFYMKRIDTAGTFEVSSGLDIQHQMGN